MLFLVVTIGSAGDVYPFVGLGKELKRRGHRVTVMTGDYFGDAVRRAGLDFVPLFSSERYGYIMDHPDLWHPRRGFQLLHEEVFIPLTSVTHRLVAEHFQSGQTGVVASTLAFGARTAQEKRNVPVVSVHLQPAIFWSVHDSPVFASLGRLPAMPRWAKRALFALMNAYVDGIVAPGLNAQRRSVGLAPVRRILSAWIHSPLAAVGLFPEWWAPPQADWPVQAKLAGFPLYDAAEEAPGSPEVDAFMGAGAAPVVFTAGSGMKQGRWFFEAAVDACARLGCRGLLISNFRDQLPARLPDGVLHADNAPFSAVFPKARAVVHHGGIGTTAQAVAGGVPQVVVPLAFDQFDQAMRVERLGVGKSIARRDFRGPRVTEILRAVLNDQETAANARALAQRLNGPQAIARACDFIETAFGWGAGGRS